MYLWPGNEKYIQWICREKTSIKVLDQMTDLSFIVLPEDVSLAWE